MAHRLDPLKLWRIRFLYKTQIIIIPEGANIFARNDGVDSHRNVPCYGRFPESPEDIIYVYVCTDKHAIWSSLKIYYVLLYLVVIFFLLLTNAFGIPGLKSIDNTRTV